MPLIPEEPQIPESAQGPRTNSASGRSVPTPRPVPGPRPAAASRPGRPGPAQPKPPAQRSTRDSARPAPAAPAAPAAAAASDSPQIQLIPASVEGALAAAEEAVDLLLDSGRPPGDVLVITTGELHPWATHERSFGDSAYWAQHDARDDVFHAGATDLARASVRPVVVVALNGGDDSAAAAALPLALGRAEALLIVCGDPQRINSALGVGV
ncbi:hypothetical protein DSC45_30665 [Streptomyces sp. YIM 130001]|uniref:hypothetical protein n=1 Tax=Streptomyces sp. YIM 130001 TaxID=2259644 RepID=UPI000E64CCDE|nr:hypothetical protein [Streptomyces sp. YIM 130001]RII09444.1 hypothetical protein DSC45_30665 [Streptomyces sp. YIM 130001]